jgi:hypothetical protein
VLISCCTVADARVVEYVRAYAKVCLSVSKLETHVHGIVDFHSTNEVEVLIVAGSVVDARVVEYESASVSVSVSVSVRKLKTLLHSCNSNWRRFSEGRSSVSASPRELIPIDRGSPYSASRVEEGLSSLKVSGEGTIHTV